MRGARCRPALQSVRVQAAHSVWRSPLRRRCASRRSTTRAVMQSAGQRRKFIVDTDAGVDDAVAIILLLSTVRKTPIDIVAFTSVQVTTNIGRLLDIAGTTVPFYKGACEPVLGKHVGCIHWEGHGKDGLGDALALPKSDRKPEAEHAASAIVRLVHAHPNELTIILLGPMTNLAVALKLDPSIANKIKEVYFIGGTTEGRGNQTMVAEFNIHSDPEAADIVLSSMPPGTLTMISWELTEYNTLPWAWYDEWLKMEHTAKLNKTMEQIMALTVRLSQKPHSWPPVAPGMNICDAVCMAVAMYPDIITKAETRFVAVELAGTYTRGMTCIDWYSHTKNKANVRIVLTVDHSRYQAILKGMFTT